MTKKIFLEKNIKMMGNPAKIVHEGCISLPSVQMGILPLSDYFTHFCFENESAKMISNFSPARSLQL